MFEPEREAQQLALSLRRMAAAVPAEKRLKVPGATKEVLGLRKPQLLSTVSEWLSNRPGMGQAELFATCRYLWSGSTREEQFVASRLLGRRAEALAPLQWPAVHQWLEDVDSIEGADFAAIYILGPWTGQDLEQRLPWLETLLAPGDLVGRRVALVATTALRAKPGYPGIVQKFVRTTASDREPLVMDGSVWALCALSRHHREVVEQFLAETPSLDRAAVEQVENWLSSGTRKGLVDLSWRIPRRNPA